MYFPQFNYHTSLLYLPPQTNKDLLLEVLHTFAIEELVNQKAFTLK